MPKVIAVADEQAIAHARPGLDGAFVTEFGIELLAVDLSEQCDRARAVQETAVVSVVASLEKGCRKL